MLKLESVLENKVKYSRILKFKKNQPIKAKRQCLVFVNTEKNYQIVDITVSLEQRMELKEKKKPEKYLAELLSQYQTRTKKERV